MADKLIVNGLGKQFDGEYEFDLAGMLVMGTPDTLTNGELHTIKRLSGVRAGEIEDALNAGDNDLLLALGQIVLARNGKRLPEQLMWDAPAGSGIMIEPDNSDPDEDAEDDAGPPDLSPTKSEPSEASEPPATSGGASSNPPSAADPPNGPPPTGSPLSETPSGDPDSVPAT